MGTGLSNASKSALRVAASGSGRLSSRSHRSGARSRASSWSGRAEVAIKATPSVATAVRSSPRIRAATGSAVAGSRASTSVISSTPPPARTLFTAEATVLSRSSALSAPTSGPSSSTTRRPSHTARTSVTLPTPAGPDTSTPRLVAAPNVFSRCGSSRASLSHSVSLAACGCEPLSSSTRICGVAVLSPFMRGRHGAGGDTDTPGHQRVGLHADRSLGVDAGDGQQLRGPADPDRRRQRTGGGRRRRARAQVAWQQRHRIADRHHLAEQRLSQGDRRNRLGGKRRAAQRHRSRAVNDDRADDHRGALTQPGIGQRHVVEQHGAEGGVLVGQAGHRRRCARPGQRHRIPFPDAQGGNGIRV